MWGSLSVPCSSQDLILSKNQVKSHPSQFSVSLEGHIQEYQEQNLISFIFGVKCYSLSTVSLKMKCIGTFWWVLASKWYISHAFKNLKYIGKCILKRKNKLVRTLNYALLENRHNLL